jgi:dTDP-3-amino-3,4,6-trideoxy-alpha-D-glucose transaminase
MAANSILVPMVNLRPAIEEAASSWRANLQCMFDRAQFVGGEQSARFEEEFAAFHGARFAVGVGSGTDALALSLRAAGVAPGREVLVPALTSPFTALAVLEAGAIPSFADVNPKTLLLDSDDAGERMSRKSAAIVTVHLYGNVSDLRTLSNLARETATVLVQDACQAHGARFEGRPLSDFSDPVAYSFYPTKNLGALGDGGAILTDRKRLSDRLRLLRDGGRSGGQISRVPGINSRLDEIQCCYLRAFLAHLPEWNERRARLAAIYDEALTGCDGIRPIARGQDSAHHLYVARAARRNRLREFLLQRGIASAVHYPMPLPFQPAFRTGRVRPGDFPVAEKACREIVSLPLWPHMPDSVAGDVAQAVRGFYG